MSDFGRRLLIFEAGDYLFAVDARDAAEVLEPVDPTPIPGAIPCVLGLINLRGTLAVAADLAVLLEAADREGIEEPALIVLARDARRLALRVDRVVGILPAPEGLLDVGADLLDALGEHDLAAGVGEFGGRPYLQLDVDAIFARVLDQPRDRDESLQTASIEG